VLVCAAFIIYYTFITLFFLSKQKVYLKIFIDQAHLCLDYAVDQILSSLGVYVNDTPIILDIVVALAVAAIVYPLCLIKEFHRIKVISLF